MRRLGAASKRSGRPQIEAMIAALGDDGEPRRASCGSGSSATAEGNPLFVEEMVAILPEQGGDETAVPPTIQALLAARLDRLGGDERSVAGAASVVGQEFSEREVAAVEDRPALAGTVDALVRPARSSGRPRSASRRAGSASGTCSPAMPPTRRCRRLLRSELHERFARFIEQRGG